MLARPLLAFLREATLPLCYPHALPIAFRRLHTGPSSLPTPPPLDTLTNASNSNEALAWIFAFKMQQIPKSLVELSFSRSSGPGGQNVNKVNTKATLRCPLNSEWIPLWAREHIRKTPHYVSTTQSIQITSTVYRSQSQNVQDCLSKLHALIVSASSASLIKETSEEQKERVRRLERAEKAKRKTAKVKRSEIKRSRSSRDWD
ncbi:uncharacterized protein LAESUDRAFT_650825 [Laetiporus sulphureus 93-53]|uniref:Prokaryotic-type class I peptide chain release factors domain-containing protein n=1 Tax=Laetiporus sulphureus 93-53 TaxID=1314785 RepID=A0A165ERJ9_9APHY|nr:uncharacterized protein LAESUDRAFT_650825 [Laetiporus sulphureus 93-53]KZT07619.1 hypothetical protein LAESUDRAFT_650825 [Laetiporus sulphureus 93-53]